MTVEFILLCVAILTIAITISLVATVKLWIEVKAMQRSTHSIQFVDPLKQQFETLTEEDKKALTGDPFGNLQ